MSTEGHIKALKAKHRELHARIEVLEAEHVDEKYITPLKKEKLRIKDELSHFEVGK